MVLAKERLWNIAEADDGDVSGIPEMAEDAIQHVTENDYLY